MITTIAQIIETFPKRNVHTYVCALYNFGFAHIVETATDWVFVRNVVLPIWILF